MADVEIPDAWVEAFAEHRALAADQGGEFAAEYVALLRRSPGWANVRAGLAAVVPLVVAAFCESEASQLDGMATIHRRMGHLEAAEAYEATARRMRTKATRAECPQSVSDGLGPPDTLRTAGKRGSDEHSGPQGQGDGNG